MLEPGLADGSDWAPGSRAGLAQLAVLLRERGASCLDFSQPNPQREAEQPINILLTPSKALKIKNLSLLSSTFSVIN